jgi:hypothetical protein
MKDRPGEQQIEVDPAALVITREQDGRLALVPPGGGDAVKGIGVARCFPWTHGETYISVRDSEGREISLVKDPAQLKAGTREMIEQELASHEFLPRITAVRGVEDQFDVMAWNVETDRGGIELQVKNAEDVRQMDDGRVLIRDHAGGTFVVNDPSCLDAQSRRLLEERLG